MIPPSFIVGGLGVALLIGTAGYAKIQGERLETCKADYAAFVTKTKLLGEQAQEKAKKQEAQDKLRKDTTDAETQRLRVANADLAKRLRDKHSSGGGLSQAATVAVGADRACFDPTQLATALRILDEGILAIAGDGQEALDAISVARAWASSNAPLQRQ